MHKKVIFHLGFAKAGSTSFQRSMGKNREQINSQGYQLYSALTKNGVPVANELAHCIVRPVVLGSNLSQDSRSRIRENLHKQLSDKKYDKIIISGELFSYIRKPEEIEKLQNFFDFPDVSLDFKIIIVVRNPIDWYESHKSQMRKKRRGVIRQFDWRFKGSFLAKKWLMDHGRLVTLFQDKFEDVTVIEFENGPVDQAIYGAISPNLSSFNAIYANTRS